jgi:hypothetical protein
MVGFAGFGVVALLAACSGVPATVTPAETQALVTLATIAAQNNTTVAKAVEQGALFCAKAAPVVGMAPVVSAIVTASTGKTYSVIGKAAEDVAKVCAAIGAIPVSPPADPASVTVVTVKGS